MAETAVENGVVDGDEAVDSDAGFNEASEAEAAHTAQENRAEVDSEQDMNHSTLSHEPNNLSTTPADCQEISSGGLQEVSSKCVVSHTHSTATGQ